MRPGRVALLVAGGVAALLLLFLYFAGSPRVMEGRGVASGDARMLRASPTGDALAWLQSCQPPDAPDALCELSLLAEDKLWRFGDGVRLADGPAWGPDGRLGAITKFDHRTGSGELWLWSSRGSFESVADYVSAFVLGPAGSLVYLVDGTVVLRPAGGRTRTVLSPVPIRKIAATAGGPAVAIAMGDKGEMFALDGEGRLSPVLRKVTTYQLSPSGLYVVALTEGSTLVVASLAAPSPARTLARDVRSFRVASSDDAVAFVAGADQESALYLAKLDGTDTSRPGPHPDEYRWAADAPVLGWISKEQRSLWVTAVGTASRPVGNQVIDFDISDDGSTIAYTTEWNKGSQSWPRLRVAELGGKIVSTDIEIGVRKFALTPGGRAVVYCNGPPPDGCFLDISYAPHPQIGRLGGGSPFFKIAEQAPPETVRVVATTGHIFLLEAGTSEVPLLVAFSRDRPHDIDVFVDPDSVLFLPPDGRRVAYIGRAPGREGVYVADLGDWGLSTLNPRVLQALPRSWR